MTEKCVVVPKPKFIFAVVSPLVIQANLKAVIRRVDEAKSSSMPRKV